jgi:hypothetical protein
MHIPKKGLRALGIAESYSGRSVSRLARVLMRKDLRIDGFCFSRVTVGGMDATDAVLHMVHDLQRDDINVIMLSGCVIAWFNVLNPALIAKETKVPVICVTYEASDGIRGDILRHFPEDTTRMTSYDKLGVRIPIHLHTNQTIFIRCWGIDASDGARLCNDFTLEGKIPEPLRVARLCARNLIHGGVDF